MVGIQTVQLNLATSGYRIDTQTLMVSPAKEVSPEETIGVLVKCRETVHKNKTISYYTLEHLKKLAENAQEYIQKSADRHYWPLRTIINVVRGTTGQLDAIKGLQQEIERRLEAIAKEEQQAMQGLVSGPVNDEAVGKIAALFYKAHPVVRKTTSFQTAEKCIHEHILTLLEGFSAKELSDWLHESCIHDTQLEWLKVLCRLSPSDALIANILRELQQSFQKYSFADQKLKVPLVLFLRMRGKIAEGAPQLSNLTHVRQALYYLEIPTSPPSDFNWSRFFVDARSLPQFTSFLKEVAEASKVDPAYKNLLQAGVELILLYDDEIEWLKLLFQATGDIAILDCFVDALKQLFPKEKMVEERPQKTFKIMQRFWQLASIDTEKSRLSHAEMLRMAGFIELKFYPFDPLPSYFKKHKNGIDNHLPRSLQRFKINGDTYILLKKKNDFFQTAHGGFKHATAAIRLPARPEKTAEIICQTVTATKYGGEYVNESWKKKLERELAVYHELSRAPRGIWPLLGWDSYTIVVEDGTVVPKVSIFSPLGKTLKKMGATAGTQASTLERLDSFENKNELKNLIAILTDLACGVEYMHDRGYLHGDLKSDNALVRTEEKLYAGLIDFGSAFKPNQEAPRVNISKGHYGTVDSTAPELFGDEEYAGTFFPLDIWALGTIFYQLCTKSMPLWQLIIRQALAERDRAHHALKNAKLEKQPDSVIKELEELLAACEQKYEEGITNTQAEFRQCVLDEIEKPLSTLPEKPSSYSGMLARIFYNMLRVDPKKRWTIHQVVDALNRLLEKASG